MLVLDVADDLFDDVLDRHQSFGPAEFVDNNREMRALAAHSRQQLDHAHRFGHEQWLAHQCLHRSFARLVEARDEDVLYVDHDDDVEPAQMIGDEQRMGLHLGTFEPHPRAEDPGNAGQEAPWPG